MNLELLMLKLLNMSDKASSANNQQGSRPVFCGVDPSETTRRAPSSEKAIKAYLLGALHNVLKTSHKKFVKIIGSLHHRKIKIFRTRMMI